MSARTKFTPFQTVRFRSPDSVSTFWRSCFSHSVTLARRLCSLSYLSRLTTSAGAPSAEAIIPDAESEISLPRLKGQQKTRTKANWNLPVSLCGEKRKISPVSISEINKTRSGTLFFLMAMIAFHLIHDAPRIVLNHIRCGPSFPSRDPDSPGICLYPWRRNSTGLRLSGLSARLRSLMRYPFP